MIRFAIGWMALMLVCCSSPAALGACAVNDSDFNTEGGGCKDLDNGLVWSMDLRAYGATQTCCADVEAITNNACNTYLNSNPTHNGGYTDWRTPTLGEVQESLANGLNSHLKFFNSGNPDDGKYRWTSCRTRPNSGHIYAIRFSDGATIATLGGFPMVCVRGQPADPANDCPKAGKKKRATSALSQTSTGALLMLPLAVVLAARCLQARRQMAV